MTDLARNIKRFRLKMGYSQDSLSEITEIPQSAISKYEKGLTEPKGAMLIALADALNTTTDALLGRV